MSDVNKSLELSISRTTGCLGVQRFGVGLVIERLLVRLPAGAL